GRALEGVRNHDARAVRHRDARVGPEGQNGEVSEAPAQHQEEEGETHLRSRTSSCLECSHPRSAEGKKVKSGTLRALEWRPAGSPEEVRAKDFPDKRLGK